MFVAQAFRGRLTLPVLVSLAISGVALDQDRAIVFSCREAAVYVACSTLCFARHPLEQALRMIAELEFRKVDVAIHESGPHLRPSQVALDVSLAAQQIRIGPTLTPSAFSVEFGVTDET